ncbi:MAG: hypothetical protein ACYS8W_08455 [Planctomycetota bacterium]|jgi:hypothetical protein
MRYLGHGLVQMENSDNQQVIVNVNQITHVEDDGGVACITLTSEETNRPCKVHSRHSVDNFARELERTLPDSH